MISTFSINDFPVQIFTTAEPNFGQRSGGMRRSTGRRPLGLSIGLIYTGRNKICDGAKALSLWLGIVSGGQWNAVACMGEGQTPNA